MGVNNAARALSVTHTLTTILFLTSCATAAMVGGWRKQDPHRKKYLHFAHYAVSKQTTALSTYNTVVRVLDVKSQVVAGVNYKLTFTTAPTNCFIGKVHYSPNLCTPAGQENALCSAVVYTVPWMNLLSVTSYNCSSINFSHLPFHQEQVPLDARKGGGSSELKLK